MIDKTFADCLCEAVSKKKSVLCVGLDPQLCYMPPHLIQGATEEFLITPRAMGAMFLDFNRRIIDAVGDIVVCVKPNWAFYVRYGSWGVMAFEKTIEYARNNGLLVIADAKCGDGGDTANAYADAYLGEVPFFAESTDPTVFTRILSPVRADCLTVNGYIGEDCVGRFIKVAKEHGTGVFVVTKTSFKPNSAVEQFVLDDGIPVWQGLAYLVSKWGEGTEGACGLRNVGVVLGATYPEDAPKMRNILPNSIFLIPGLGGQGASADDAVVGIRPDGFGGIVNDSRNLTYAWQNKKGKYQCEPEKFADAARCQAIEDRDALVDACKKAGKWPHS